MATIEYLVNSPADINYAYGLAFCYVCVTKRMDVVNYFLQYTIDPEYLVRGAILAFKYNHLEISEQIIGYGVNLQSHRNTIYHYAAYNGNSDMIQYFINYGLVLDSNMPLVTACNYGNEELVNFYLGYGLLVDNTILNCVLKNINIPIIKIF